jgi:hypothetical protein
MDSVTTPPLQDESKGPETTAILIVFLIVGSFAVVLRYFTRLVLVKHFDNADALIGISLVNSPLIRLYPPLVMWLQESYVICTWLTSLVLQITSLGTTVCQIERKTHLILFI